MAASFRISPGVPALVLAPMEGVTDFPMRALLTERGGFDLCVSEFLRISQEVPPPRVFIRHAPELAEGGCTRAGVPVMFQLLGGDPEKLAESASLAIEMGASGVDLNFGCPAPTVNRHDGGATLLKYPRRIRTIVEAVRRSVPPEFPVSAKLRLGWDQMNSIHENSEHAAEGGADWITIHGRTRMQGYTPPAYWGPIGEVKRRLRIPVIANGEIWSMADLRRCQDETGAEHFMLGRGVLADPLLAIKARAVLLGELDDAQASWSEFLNRFVALSDGYYTGPGYMARRMKQWLKFAHLRKEIDWFDKIKRLVTEDEILNAVSETENRFCEARRMRG